MICNRCGKELSDGTNFCDECGNDLRFSRDNNQSYGQDNNQNYYQNYNYNYNTNYPNMVSAKSKVAAGLFGIFLGGLGVHNFYLGYTGRAVAQLLISVLSCGFLAVVSGIWGLIEGILILTGRINVDADGNPLRD